MKTYSLLAMCLLFALHAFAGEQKTYEGTLKTGIVAIGGETSGTILVTKQGVRYELDLGSDAALAKQADALSGHYVAVTGEMKTVKGVETGDRAVVVITSLKELKAR